MKIAFVASAKPAAQQALQEAIERYDQNNLSEAEYIVAVGGDGTTLRALYATLHGRRIPVFPCAWRLCWLSWKSL
jgi:NAD+ kinase